MTYCVIIQKASNRIVDICETPIQAIQKLKSVHPQLRCLYQVLPMVQDKKCEIKNKFRYA